MRNISLPLTEGYQDIISRHAQSFIKNIVHPDPSDPDRSTDGVKVSHPVPISIFCRKKSAHFFVNHFVIHSRNLFRQN